MRKKNSSKSRGVTSLNAFVGRLRSTMPSERDKASLELRQFLEETKAALWQSIRRRSNRNNRGTLVRTLQWFNCSSDFDELIDLALNGNYEVQCHALRILHDQSFRVNKRQLIAARRALRVMRPRENLPANVLVLFRAEMESALARIDQASAGKSLAAG